ncbi:MAG: hypothetical protein K2M89_00425 [Clostridiales bacterium]|nr:hypothetical protein [Clostridiales bacterium]
MKKTVKSLIIAASVAAIAGIGAVSFAAWNGGTVTPADTTGTVGNIVTDAGVLAVAQTDNLLLIPYDQTFGVDTTTMTTMQSFTVTYTQGTGAAAENYDFSMKLTENTGNLTLYYKLGSATAPDKTDEVSDLTTNGWTLFGTGDIALTLTSNTATINVILVSSNPDDMDATYEITVSAAEAA